MSTPNIDDVAQTLAEYERLAISSGAQVQIDPPEFSTDGETWTPIWLSGEPPAAARATVHRDGTPTIVYATWEESIPIDTSLTNDGRRWCDIWVAKPMQRFGSFVVRSALRRAFREVIGDHVEADEDAPRIADAPSGDRDWDAEIHAAQTEEAVKALHVEMKTARAVTVVRERALRDQLKAVTTDAWLPAQPAAATNDDRSEKAKPGELRDFLPSDGNRAARRKAAKRKGRR